MLDQDGGELRSVAWTEIFPWLGLYRCFRLAIGMRMLLLAAAAILLTVSGWALLGWLFSTSPQIEDQSKIEDQVDPYEGCPWLALSSLIPESPFGIARYYGLPEAGKTSENVLPSQSYLMRDVDPVWGYFEPVYGTWEHLSRPFRQLFDGGLSWTRLAFVILCGLWAAAVWAFFGGAITRVAAVRLAAEERVSWGEMLRYAAAKWPAYFMAPLFPLAGVLILTVPMAVASLLLWLPWGIGTLLLGILWWLFLIGGLVMALLLLGLWVGWPLMWATISAEGTDSFDALSRTYAYVYQRPLHYLFYIVVAFLLGLLGWLLVANFTAGAIHLTYWAAHWGGGTQQVAAIASGAEGLEAAGPVGAVLIRFWAETLKIVAVGFLFSYFWVAMTAIYFLMRRVVDATEMDEVYLEEEQDDAHGLPPLKTDEAGVTVVDDEEEDEER